MSTASWVASPGMVSSSKAEGWRRVFPFVTLALTCAFLFFQGLGAGELWRTEGLRARIAQEMLHSGDWIVPTLYGQPIFTKPPGMYWAIALVSWPFGAVTTWTARLPSTLAASATVFLFFWYFRRALGTRAGLIAGLMVPMSMVWLDKAPAAEIDMLQVAWVTGSILFFLRALEEEEKVPGEPEAPSEGAQHPSRDAQGPTIGWWLAALLCVAGGTLTKWTAPAFFYGTVIPLLWWCGRLHLLLSWRHLFAAGLAASLVLAWIGAAVAQTGWTVFYDAVSREALQRLAPGYAARPYPWLAVLAHPLVVLGANLPWSVLVLAAFKPGFASLWDERGRRLLQALHCWAWPNLLFWSIHSEHTLRNRAPLFPALAGLAVLVWLAWEAGQLRLGWRWLRPVPLLVGFLAVWIVLKMVLVYRIMPQRELERQLRDKAAVLAAWLPGDGLIYLFRLKDEGLMFYLGRPLQRLGAPAELPSAGGPFRCILTGEEWRHWDGARRAELIGRLADAQGDPLVVGWVY